MFFFNISISIERKEAMVSFKTPSSITMNALKHFYLCLFLASRLAQIVNVL